MQAFKSHKKQLILLASMALVLCCWKSAFTQSAEVLLAKRITLHEKQATISQVLNRLAERQDVPIGLERPLSWRDERKISIEADGQTLEDVLTLIVQSAPIYRWRFVDGAINVAPVTDQDVVVSRVLAEPIKSFEISQNVGSIKLWLAVLDVAEVLEFVKAQRLTVSHSANYSGFLLPNPPESNPPESPEKIIVKDVDYRTLLNRLTITTQNKFWLAFRSGDKLEFLHVQL